MKTKEIVRQDSKYGRDSKAVAHENEPNIILNLLTDLSHLSFSFVEIFDTSQNAL